MDFHFNIKKKRFPTASAKKCFWLCRHPLHFQLTELRLLFALRGFDVSRQADVNIDENSVRVPTGRLPNQPGLPKTLEEQHDRKGISVWESITKRPKLYLSHLFLPLWHWENCSQSLGAGLAPLHTIHHKSFHRFPGPIPRLFPWLPVCCFHQLFAAIVQSSLLPLPAAVTLCMGIHHLGHWGQYLSFVLARKEKTGMASHW